MDHVTPGELSGQSALGNMCQQIPLEQACPTFNLVRETLENVGLHAGNIEFDTQNEGQISKRIILPVRFYTSCAIKIQSAYNNRKEL